MDNLKKMANQKKRKRKTTERERLQIRQCHSVVGMTLEQIGRAFNLTAPAIFYILKKNGLDRRTKKVEP